MSDVFVNQVERVGDSTTGLAIGRQAVIYDASVFTVTDDPDAIVSGPRQEKITGVTRVTRAAPPQVPPGATGPAVAGTGTTPVALFSFSIPTGYDAIVTFDILGKVTGGSGAGGHTGQRVGGACKLLFVNPGGTPSLSTGTLGPMDGIFWTIDETSGFIAPTFSAAFAANSVTVKVAGIANVNVDWSAVVTSISLPQE